MNASLVAFYGPKPAALVELVESVQSQLRRLFGEEFSPYQVEQVHATLIGLEGDRNAVGELFNANYLSMRGEARTMDLSSLLEHVKRTDHLPFTVRIGGFEESRPYPFTSRGAHPFSRTFSIQGAQAVVMGWPCSDGLYPTTLGRLRHELEAFGVLHKYHAVADDLDNDLFMVVGRMRTQVDDAVRGAAVDELRERLAGAPPVEIVVDASSLMVVSYVDPALPLETSVASRLLDIDAERLAALRDAH